MTNQTLVLPIEDTKDFLELAQMNAESGSLMSALVVYTIRVTVQTDPNDGKDYVVGFIVLQNKCDDTLITCISEPVRNPINYSTNPEMPVYQGNVVSQKAMFAYRTKAVSEMNASLNEYAQKTFKPMFEGEGSQLGLVKGGPFNQAFPETQLPNYPQPQMER